MSLAATVTFTRWSALRTTTSVSSKPSTPATIITTWPPDTRLRMGLGHGAEVASADSRLGVAIAIRTNSAARPPKLRVQD